MIARTYTHFQHDNHECKIKNITVNLLVTTDFEVEAIFVVFIILLFKNIFFNVVTLN